MCWEALSEVAEQGGDGDAIEVKEEEHGGEEEGNFPDGDERVDEISSLLQPFLDPPQLAHGGKGRPEKWQIMNFLGLVWNLRIV